MNYFSEEHEMFRKSLRDFLKREVKPNLNKSFNKKGEEINESR